MMYADMDDILGSRDVFTIAMHIAVKHQLPRPDYPELVKKMRGKYPQPMVLENDYGRLWVDKHYVAFQLCSQADVRYEYVTAFHIAEETASYRAAAKARGMKISLPEDIARQFKSAARHMRDTGTRYWTDPEEFDRNLNTKSESCQ